MCRENRESVAVGTIHRSAWLIWWGLIGLVVVFCEGCGGSSRADGSAWARRGSQSFAELLAVRAENRSYDGAPPVIPHGVASLGRESCLNCHEAGSFDNGDRLAVPRSHPSWGDCHQCHAQRVVGTVYRESTLEPLRIGRRGHRQSSISPPTIPHTLQNREACAICHVGAQAHPVLRAKHEYRARCLQCHVSQTVWP